MKVLVIESVSTYRIEEHGFKEDVPVGMWTWRERISTKLPFSEVWHTAGMSRSDVMNVMDLYAPLVRDLPDDASPA
jgi:hypothetical protein